MKSSRSVSQGLGLALALLAFIGCQQATSPSTTTTTTSALVTATVTGRIMDQNASKPFGGATVYVGTASATTNANGVYSISSVVSGNYVLRAMYTDSAKINYSSTNDTPFTVMDLATFKTAATAGSTSSSGSSSVIPSRTISTPRLIHIRSPSTTC